VKVGFVKKVDFKSGVENIRIDPMTMVMMEKMN